MSETEKYLNKLLRRNETLATLRYRYEEQLAKCTRIGQEIERERVQTSIEIYAHEDEMVTLAMISEEIDQMERMAEEAKELFAKLSDERLRLIMELRYIDLLPWVDVIDILELSRSWATELRDRAVVELKTWMKKRTTPDIER